MGKAKRKVKLKYNLHSMNYLRSLTRQEVFKYIQRLHKVVKKQEKRLLKFKHKLRFLSNGEQPDGTEVELEVARKVETKAKTFLDEIKEAAEIAQNETDFVYDPTSGLYYDQRTGYYYNAEYGLYYDGTTGCYYKYDQDKNQFEFHSQVETQQENMDKNPNRNDHRISNGKKSDRKRKKKSKKRSHSSENDDKEDGEIPSSSDDDDDVIFVETDDNEMNGRYEDIAKKYPPSLRIVVQETNLPKLKVGALFIITFKGGTLGREGDHDVIIPDLNVSKYHLKFIYDETAGIYKCIDFGSRNGTVLNGKRMSNAKQESEPLDVIHGSTLQLSQTKLLCHIHNGNSTCGHCEPGLIIGQENVQKVVTLSHKEQLKKLQKRYGLENERYIVDVKNEPQYSDRAAARRVKVGSTNEYEKTQAASVETEISSENKGFKMLAKLGWNKGETLGKGKDGLLEPIAVLSNKGKTGLGCDSGIVSVPLTRKDQRKTEALKKTQERYNKLPPADIFANSDDSS